MRGKISKLFVAGSGLFAGSLLAKEWLDGSEQPASNLSFRMLGSPPHDSADPSSKQKHCIVVGAGLEGLTTALLLQETGWRVTVVDAASGPATQTSYANAVSTRAREMAISVILQPAIALMSRTHPGPLTCVQ
jgi:NADPH-dependent 2,4-dienoyl-CoA reductase/sulfur reductase-like enzyme